MVLTEAEIERMARELIDRYGANAVKHAIERLNEMIDRGNIRGRDIWACVVHAIHQHQETAAAPAEAPAGWPGDANRLDCAPILDLPSATLFLV